MVKAAIDVSPIVDAYVEKLKKAIDVERIVLVDILTEGVDGEPSDIKFMVFPPRSRQRGMR